MGGPHWGRNVVGIEQLLQHGLTFKLGLLAKVLAIEPQQIEGVVNQAVLTTCSEFGLQL
jgi:hypothetical protein